MTWELLRDTGFDHLKTNFKFFIDFEDPVKILKKYGSDVGYIKNGYIHVLDNKKDLGFNPMYDSIPTRGTDIIINIDVYPIMPNEGNAVFYEDVINLKNVELDKSMSNLSWTEEVDIQSVFGNGKNILLSILPMQMINPKFTGYVTLKYGDPFQFIAVGTSLVLKQDTDTISLEWVSKNSMIDNNIEFRLMSEDHKIGDTVCYDDTFYVTLNRYNILTIENNMLSAVYQNLDKVKSYKPYTFKFIPKVYRYYCSSGSIRKVNLSETNTQHLSALVNGNVVVKNKNILKCKRISKILFYTIIVLLIGVCILVMINL